MVFMITIVSGLPRSGTSLMMQMLVAGGMTPLSDGERAADADNPRGYLEWERIKTLPNDPGCIAEAEGKVVKVISRLLRALPEGHEYRVVFMQRPMAEVLASQDAMLKRRGKYKEGIDLGMIARQFERDLQAADDWMNRRPNVRAMRVAYQDVLRDPKETAKRLAEFLDLKLDTAAMAEQVDASLYRNRGK